ncbi:unknown protein [Leptolyngbya sp. NIES-3755]|nr:unknown protein [Leptolyngbya sp. NIES-3755]
MCLNNENESLLPPNCRITSPSTPNYNSIAWAAGENERNWQPLAMGRYYWPVGIPRENTLQAWIRVYRSLGFEVDSMQRLNYERGTERIAIYADGDDRPCHVARQITEEMIVKYPLGANFRKDQGKWISKITDQEDICHDTVSDIEGRLGYVITVMMRPSRI